MTPSYELRSFFQDVLDGHYGDSNLHNEDIAAFFEKADQSDIEDVQVLRHIWETSSDDYDRDMDELENTIYNVVER